MTSVVMMMLICASPVKILDWQQGSHTLAFVRTLEGYWIESRHET